MLVQGTRKLNHDGEGFVLSKGDQCAAQKVRREAFLRDLFRLAGSEVFLGRLVIILLGGVLGNSQDLEMQGQLLLTAGPNPSLTSFYLGRTTCRPFRFTVGSLRGKVLQQKEHGCRGLRSFITFPGCAIFAVLLGLLSLSFPYCKRSSVTAAWQEFCKAQIRAHM